MRKKLAIISTHPIQYNAPLFALLTKRKFIDIKVFYTWGAEVMKGKFDPGFGKNIDWDIPLLEGYEYEFMENAAADKGSHHFNGINNPALTDAIGQWNADAVMVYGWSFKSHLKAIRYFHGRIPVYFRGDSTSLNKKGIKQLIRKFFLRWVYSHIDIAFYVGAYNKAYYTAHGLHEEQLVFAPHAVDNDRFYRSCGQQPAAFKFLDDKKKNNERLIIFLYAGKLDDNKNVHLLAEQYLTAAIPDSMLLIAGNGECERGLKEKFSHQDNILFLPFQNQSSMPALYGMADVFVLPSKSETWGLGINEAMACGKAVIASNGCAGAADLIESGFNGYVFDLAIPNDLSKKLILASNKSTTRQMGLNALQKISQWSIDKVAGAIEAVVIKK